MAKAENFDIRRQVVAFSTTDSWRKIPHVSYLYEPDITEFFAYFQAHCREAKRPDGTPIRITFNTVILKAVAEGLHAAPRLNAFLSYSAFSNRGRLTVQPHVNITLPWRLEDGTTLTVVVPRVEEKSLVEIQIAVEHLGQRIDNTDVREVLNAAAVRDTRRRLRAGDPVAHKRILSIALGLNRLAFLHGSQRREYYGRDASMRLGAHDIDTGTVVVSNIGSIRREGNGRFLLIDIIAPQVFAIGISALQERPGIVVESGTKKIGIRNILPFCLVFDHRAFEFSEIIPFLECLDRLFADPERLSSLMDHAAP